MFEVDFLIIGSGIAGLSYALQVARDRPELKVAIVTKASANESNTKYAQGGVAIVVNKEHDSFDQHIQDTIKAGDGLCDPLVVESVITQGPQQLQELIQWGVEFDKRTNGEFDLGLEGGHSQNRILHHKDITGKEIEQSLLKQIHALKNIEIYTQHLAIDLITQHQVPHEPKKLTGSIRCYGAYILDMNTNKVETFSAKITMLATGGIGQVYHNTTNPTVATGDGIGMAYRARATIKNMEFIQFHPTALNHCTDSPSFLISEAVRGFGGLLRNQSDELFMAKYDPRSELASRDIVCRAIESELKKSKETFVWLDCRHLEMSKFKTHFPTIYNKMREKGIHLEKDMIPVVPAAHYLCGGIAVNESGQTSIDNLYACGECSSTGLHGANRLASNSLLEALVYANKSYEHSINSIDYIELISRIPNWNEENISTTEETVSIAQTITEIKKVMSTYVGVIRSNKGLEIATGMLRILYKRTELLYNGNKMCPQLIELRNMIAVAHLVVRQSIGRNENRGGFYNVDSII